MPDSEDPLPPPTTSSSTVPQSHRSRSVASSRSRSGSASRQGSRSGSLQPAVRSPSADRHISVPISGRPIKRERSASVDNNIAGPSASQSLDEYDGPPSLKRMRLQTDSIDDVNRYLIGTANSSFDAGHASSVEGASSHGQETTAHVQRTQLSRSHPIDVDALQDGAVRATTSEEGAAGPSSAADAKAPTESMNDKNQSEPLSSYTCPICFSAPRYATLTPCGHICCGECLFTAVKATIERAQYHGPASQNAKCPVCRAPIPGWDGQGGGVIGLKARVAYSGSTKRS